VLGLACSEVEGPSVPRANDSPILDESLAEGPLLMRANVVEYGDLPVVASDAKLAFVEDDFAGFTLGWKGGCGTDSDQI